MIYYDNLSDTDTDSDTDDCDNLLHVLHNKINSYTIDYYLID